MSHAQPVTFRTEDHPELALMIGPPSAVPGGDIYDVPIHVTGDWIDCSDSYLSHRGDGLDSFFAELARDWKGWSGPRHWEAFEHGMAFTATHTGRRVELAITLPDNFGRRDWELTVRLSYLPGEELQRLARDVQAAFSGL